MTNLIQFLQGKKTYLLAAAAIVYAIAGFYLGQFDAQTALQMVWAALTTGALRAGIAKVSPQQAVNYGQSQTGTQTSPPQS